MPFDMAFAELAHRCAPGVELAMAAAVVDVQSGFDPLLVAASKTRPSSASVGEAVASAVTLLDAGDAVRVGFGGFEARRLTQVWLSLTEAFDGCKALAAIGDQLEHGLAQGRGRGLDGAALEAAAYGHVLKTAGAEPPELRDLVAQMGTARRALSPDAATLRDGLLKRLAAAEQRAREPARMKTRPTEAPAFDVYGTHTGAGVMVFSKQETKR